MSTYPADTLTLTRKTDDNLAEDSCVLDIGGMTCAACRLHRHRARDHHRKPDVR